MVGTTVYDEVIEFIAGTSPEKVIAFRPSAKMQERVSALIFKEKNQSLTAVEKSDLNNYLVVEHLMRMAKARAFQINNVN
jgi:hypothetical protein